MAVLKGKAAPAGVVAAPPALAAVPDAPAATEQRDGEPAAPPKAKPKAKPETPAVAAAPAGGREASIAKFAKAMNADAEKEGVAVDAPAAERRGKPGPKPGAKREPKPAAELEPETPAPSPKKPQPAAQAQPTSDDQPELDDAETDDAQDDDDSGTPEPRAQHQLKAKARLRHGDVDKALRIAFGDLKPEEFEGAKEALAKKLGVSSKQWADFRRYASAEQGKAKQLEQNATQLSQRLRTEFEPMIQARKAFAAKDYPKAFELAFPGEDINTFQRKAIHQHLSKDPDKARLEQQIEELRGEVSKLKQPAQSQEQASPEQAQAAALQREGNRTHEALTKQTDDPEIAHMARKTKFIHRVVELRGEHYDPQSRTTIPLLVAADMARTEIKQELEQWRYDPEASGEAAPISESPGQAGNEPVRTSHRARSPIPSQAAQAGGSTRSMSREERIKAFAARM